MEETKIWAVEGTAAKPLNTANHMETEELLEDILTANPDMLENSLQLVGRQTSTTGGPLDLLGVDAEGRLVVFELKRGTLNREAVAQVIDYASSLDAMDMDRLVSHIEQRSGDIGIDKIDDFSDWYSDNWSDEGVEALMPPRMVLVGLGVDDTTERMVNYMVSMGMDISLLTFHGFTTADGKTLLARNVEVDKADTVDGTPRKVRSYNRRARFVQNLETLSEDMRFVVNYAERMFMSVENRFTKIYSTTRMSFLIDFSWSEEYAWNEETRAKRRFLSFIEIDSAENIINVGFSWIAIGLASEEFSRIDNLGDEYKVSIRSLEEWDAQNEELTALTQKVCAAYNVAREKALSNQ